MMFVKILAVLYELHLEYLKKRSDRIHGRYRTAFANFYRLFDEYVEVCAEYEHMPRSVLGEKEQAYIDAAGGRQSKAYVEMKKRELMAAKIDLAVARALRRATQADDGRVAIQSRSTAASASRAASAALQ
jgi:hypothetical protein